MSLFKSIVLLDVMKVISADNECPLHFQTLNNTSQDTTTDAHITSERAFLVNVCAFNSLQKIAGF